MDNQSPPSRSDGILQSVKVDVMVSLGKVRPSMAELSGLSPDVILPLDTVIDDPVGLYVGSRLVAEGVLEEPEDGIPGSIAVRISRIVDTNSSGE